MAEKEFVRDSDGKLLEVKISDSRGTSVYEPYKDNGPGDLKQWGEALSDVVLGTNNTEHGALIRTESNNSSYGKK